MSGCAGELVARSVSQRSVESPSPPLSLPESEESASSPLSPSLTVAPPWARTSGQMVLICSSWSWVVSTPMARPPLERTSLQVIPQQASYDTLRPPQRPSPIASQTAETDAHSPAWSTAAGYQLWTTRRCVGRLPLARPEGLRPGAGRPRRGSRPAGRPAPRPAGGPAGAGPAAGGPPPHPD